jgi:hypothetical protein
VKTTEESPQEISEEEEKEFLGNIIYAALDRLDEDQSETGNLIKAKISQKMKHWLKNTKKCQTNSDETDYAKMEMISPAEEKNEDSLNRLSSNKGSVKPKNKINIKRAKS